MEMGVALEILKLLEREPRQSPQTIALKIPNGLSSIKTALVTLSDTGLVIPIAHGVYEITDLGRLILKEKSGGEASP